MTREELLKKIGKCSDLAQEVYGEGVISVGVGGKRVQCDIKSFIKLVDSEPITIKPCQTEGYPRNQRATAYINGFEVFTLATKSEMSIIQVELKKAATKATK